MFLLQTGEPPVMDQYPFRPKRQSFEFSWVRRITLQIARPSFTIVLYFLVRLYCLIYCSVSGFHRLRRWLQTHTETAIFQIFQVYASRIGFFVHKQYCLLLCLILKPLPAATTITPNCWFILINIHLAHVNIVNILFTIVNVLLCFFQYSLVWQKNHPGQQMPARHQSP